MEDRPSHIPALSRTSISFPEIIVSNPGFSRSFRADSSSCLHPFFLFCLNNAMSIASKPDSLYRACSPFQDLESRGLKTAPRRKPRRKPLTLFRGGATLNCSDGVREVGFVPESIAVGRESTSAAPEDSQGGVPCCEIMCQMRKSAGMCDGRPAAHEHIPPILPTSSI